MRAIPLLFCPLQLIAVAQTISFLPPQAHEGGGASFVAGCSGCVAVADFNPDGNPAIPYNVQTPSPQGGVLLGNGDGTFRPVLRLSDPAIGSFLVGDFNGDGKPDLVFAGYSAAVYLGKGDGTFESPFKVSACTATTGYVTIQVGDFD